MDGPMSEAVSYYPYWDRVAKGAIVVAVILIGELGMIMWGVWRK